MERNIHPLVGLNDMVLDPGYGSFNAGAGNIARASSVALNLPIDGVLDQVRGQQALIAGVEKVGSALGQLGIEQMKAVGIRQEAEADIEMEKSDYELQEKLAAEPDETKWKDMAAAHYGDLRSRLGKQKMMASAREAVDMKLSRFTTQRLGQIGVQSAKESIRRATTAIGDKVNLAVANNDLATAEHNINAGVSAGYFSGDHGALMKKDASEKVNRQLRDQARDAAMKAAIADPEAWLATNTKPAEGQDASDYLQIRSVAEGASRDLFNATQKDMADFAAQNPLATPEQMQEHAGLRLRPGELQKWKDFALTNLNDAERQRRSTPEYIRETFGSLLDAADELSKSTVDMQSDEARDKYLQIHIMAQTLPEGLRGEVTQKIERKWRQGPPEIDTTVKGYINQSVEDMFNQNAFGNLTTKVPKVEGDEGFDKGRTTYKTVVDPIGRSEAQKRRADMTIALNDWMKQNPNATREQATQAITSMAAQSMTKEDLSGLLKGANAKTTAPAVAPTGAVSWSNLLPGNVRAKVTSYGYANDSTPDGNSSAGIGAFTTQADALAGPDAPTRLKNGDFAVSSDVEQMLVNANIRPTDKVKIVLSDGSEHVGRWMDRTANDDQLKAINAKRKAAGQSEIKPLRGRIDIFNPAGKHPKDDVSVVSVSRI